MKFLEESGLYFLCHVTGNSFNQMLKDTHPEGDDACGYEGIKKKIKFLKMNSSGEDPSAAGK